MKSRTWPLLGAFLQLSLYLHWSSNVIQQYIDDVDVAIIVRGRNQSENKEYEQIRSQITQPSNSADRSLRFPSVEKRTKHYLGQWYSICGDGPIIGYRRGKAHIDISRGQSKHTVLPKVSEKDIFYVDFATIRKQTAENNVTTTLAQKVADSVVPFVDLQQWKHSLDAIPFLLQLAPAEAAIDWIPRFGRVRSLNKELLHCASRSPILWDMVDHKSLRNVIKFDTPWSQKMDKAIFRILEDPTMTDWRRSCSERPMYCALFNATKKSRLDARVVFLKSPLGESFDPRLIAPRFPTRKMYMRHKAIVLSSDDIDRLPWALLSNSVVLMPPPTVTSWLMPDQLIPWFHYVPLLSNMTNIGEQVEWVLANQNASQEIARHATLWIEDLYFHEDAESDKEEIISHMVHRYWSSFKSLALASDAKISYTREKPRIFRAGGRSEEEIIRRSLKRSSSSKPIFPAAVCHKTLFGAVDIHQVVKWAAYNYLLGFDRIFIWILPELRSYEGFETLSNLTYVTLIENRVGFVREIRPGYERVLGELDQRAMEQACLGDVAKDYEWVMLADADEYLWFDEYIGVKEFLSSYGEGYVYLSFGKYMYTNKFGVDVADSGFGLDMFPFTSGRYCFAKKEYSPAKQARFVGRPICPRYTGRSKVIVKPKNHTYVNVHGTHKPDDALGSIHFHSDIAHFKEWPGLFASMQVEIKKPVDFIVNKDANLGFHHSLDRAHKANPDGATYNVTYDSRLHKWLEFVSTNS